MAEILDRPVAGTRSGPSVLVIGAGFGGIGAAIELRRGGFRDVTVLERADDLGGVWRENTYPGAACDVPSPLYSYSYEPKPDWPQRYSGRAAIHEYLTGVARGHGLFDAIEFGVEVTGAVFDEHSGRWQVRTADGTTRFADVLIPAVGQLSRPALPAIAGIDTFAGPAFHSARWDHDVDLTGKRVACIGTGASAIQFVPEIQPVVDRLTVFQRTPPWVIPKFDTDYSPCSTGSSRGCRGCCRSNVSGGDGRNGRELADTWADGAHAHYGITVPGFPNLFMVYGPNTNLGVGSIAYMIESQARYIRQAVRLLAEHPGSYLEVRDGPEREFNTALQERLDRTPWNFCGSWYRTASGRITNNWPGTVTSYRRRTRRLKPDDYALTPAG